MIWRGKTGALAAPRRKPGPARRDAGANGTLVGPGSVLCRDLPGRRRAPGACGSTNARARLSNVGALDAAGMGQRCYTHPSARLAGQLCGVALLVQQELQLLLGRREQMRVCTCCIRSGYEREEYPNAACLPYWAVLAVSAWEGAVGKGGCFLPSAGAAGMPGIHPGYLPGEPEHGAWPPSRHSSAGFPMHGRRNSTEIEKPPPKCVHLPTAFFPPFHRKLRGRGARLAVPAGAQHPAALSPAGPGVLRSATS